jgi:hypothetical protein
MRSHLRHQGVLACPGLQAAGQGYPTRAPSPRERFFPGPPPLAVEVEDVPRENPDEACTGREGGNAHPEHPLQSAVQMDEDTGSESSQSPATHPPEAANSEGPDYLHSWGGIWGGEPLEVGDLPSYPMPARPDVDPVEEAPRADSPPPPPTTLAQPLRQAIEFTAAQYAMQYSFMFMQGMNMAFGQGQGQGRSDGRESRGPSEPKP